MVVRLTLEYESIVGSFSLGALWNWWEFYISVGYWLGGTAVKRAGTLSMSTYFTLGPAYLMSGIS